MSFNSKVQLSILLFTVVFFSAGQSFADSFTMSGPGFKVHKGNGWFGRNQTSYQDALGNRVEQNTGFFGRKTYRTGLFGTQAVQTPRSSTVVDPNGNVLVSSKRTWFHGRQTNIDGNAAVDSFKRLFRP